MKIQERNTTLERYLSFLDQDANNLNLLINIIDHYHQLGECTLAQTYLDRAKAINYEACLNPQGLLYLDQGLITQAKECFLEGLAIEETSALRYNLGLCHFIDADFETAWEVLAPLLEGTHHPDAELLMARILHRQDAIDEAIGLIENILEHNPNDEAALGMLSLMYFDLNEESLAKKTALRCLELNPDNYDGKLVSILMRLPTQETTTTEIEELIQVNAGDPRLWFALGNTHMIQGNPASAEKALQKALTIYPEFYDCQIILAWCQLLNNHVNKAMETYQYAAALIEDLADAWGGMALIHALKEDHEKAKQLIHKAKGLNPECFLTELAETIYSTHNNPSQAKTKLFKALKNSKLTLNEQLNLAIDEISS